MASYDPRFGFDPVAAFLRRPLPEVLGSNLQAEPDRSPNVPRTIEGLQQLAARYAWLAVLELSTSLLAEHDDNPSAILPHERLQCASYRALALLQTRQVASAENAVVQLGDLSERNEEYWYESYEVYEGKKGSFVPFGLRVLSVEIRIRQGDAVAITDCYQLKDTTERDASLSAEERKKRTGILLSCLASYHLAAQQHDAAADIAKQLMKHQGETALAVYMYARVLIQVGDFEAAAMALKRASTCTDCTAALRHVHFGMLQAARGRYQEALVEYDKALDEEKKDGSWPMNLWVWAGNNAAVCLLHLGRLAEAIDRLEGVLRREPQTALDEGVAFNLGIMYDLAYPQNSVEKKRVLRKLALRFGREGFDVQRIRMAEER